jgi:type II secretory pathway predicted ATPase ExeA
VNFTRKAVKNMKIDEIPNISEHKSFYIREVHMNIMEEFYRIPDEPFDLENLENSGKKEPKQEKQEKDRQDKEKPRKKPDEKSPKPLKRRGVEQWFRDIGWSTNPFTLNIFPNLFVGYEKQRRSIVRMIEEKHKLGLVLGPTGSGKTTFLQWISSNLDKNYDTLFISKPPKTVEDLVGLFKERYKPPWFLRLFISNIKNVYQIPDFLNKRYCKKHLVILCDEAHEASTDVLEWLRVLSDQVKNMTIILSGLPVFEERLKENLETFEKRITRRVELLSLTKEETKDMIRKRINYVGGTDIKPFTERAIDNIFKKSGGFPREVLRLCDIHMNKAIEKDEDVIDVETIEEKTEKSKEEETISSVMGTLTNRQKQIINILAKHEQTPADIVEHLNLQRYKSRQHAVRSVNNILSKLMEDGFVERKKQGRSFVYDLSPKIKTIVVTA